MNYLNLMLSLDVCFRNTLSNNDAIVLIIDIIIYYIIYYVFIIHLCYIIIHINIFVFFGHKSEKVFITVQGKRLRPCLCFEFVSEECI